MKELHLSIVSPEKSIFDGNVKIVTLPGMIGSFSILLAFNNSICDSAHHLIAASSHHIHHTNPFSTFIPSAFQLICRNCTAP